MPLEQFSGPARSSHSVRRPTLLTLRRRRGTLRRRRGVLRQRRRARRDPRRWSGRTSALETVRIGDARFTALTVDRTAEPYWTLARVRCRRLRRRADRHLHRCFEYIAVPRSSHATSCTGRGTDQKSKTSPAEQSDVRVQMLAIALPGCSPPHREPADLAAEPGRIVESWTDTSRATMLRLSISAKASWDAITPEEARYHAFGVGRIAVDRGGGSPRCQRRCPDCHSRSERG